MISFMMKTRTHVEGSDIVVEESSTLLLPSTKRKIRRTVIPIDTIRAVSAFEFVRDELPRSRQLVLHGEDAEIGSHRIDLIQGDVASIPVRSVGDDVRSALLDSHAVTLVDLEDDKFSDIPFIVYDVYVDSSLYEKVGGKDPWSRTITKRAMSAVKKEWPKDVTIEGRINIEPPIPLWSYVFRYVDDIGFFNMDYVEPRR